MKPSTTVRATSSREAILTIQTEELDDYNITVTQEGTGIEAMMKVQGKSVHVYPNPAEDLMTIELGEYPAIMQMYTPDGRLLKVIRAADPVNEISFCGMRSGLYLLKITSEHVSIVIRIIKE